MAKQEEIHGKLKWVGNNPIIFLDNATPDLEKALQFFSSEKIDPDEREIQVYYLSKNSEQSSGTIVLVASGRDPRAIALDFQTFGIDIEVPPETFEFQPRDVF